MATQVVAVKDFTVLNHSSRVIPNWVRGRPPYGGAVSPTTLNFSGVITGETQSKVVRVFNVGFYALVIEGVDLQISGDYSWSGNVPSSLAPGNFFDITVTYAPQNDGTSNDELTIVLGHNLDLLVVPLLGSAGWNYNPLIDEMLDGLWEFIQRSVRPALVGDGPVASLSTSSVVFPGSTDIGEHSPVITITLTNNGNQNLVVDSITTTGDFEVIE